MAEDFLAMTKARGTLIILLAACQQTLTALEASDNVMDEGLAPDLRRMIGRSSGELGRLNDRLHPSVSRAAADQTSGSQPR